jgi:hypothetical protein
MMEKERLHANNNDLQPGKMIYTFDFYYTLQNAIQNMSKYDYM